MPEPIHHGGVSVPSGEVSIHPVRGPLRLDARSIEALTDPRRANTEEAADWRSDNHRRVKRQARHLRLGERLGLPGLYGVLYLRKFSAYDQQWHDLGLASLRVVTNNGVGYIVDSFQNLVEPENMKYHGIGTGTTAEAASDAALVTEITTGLNPDNTRATGTTTEAASNIYQTVATNTVDATVAITEHGLFSQAATGGGVLFDRSVFSAVNLVSGDSIASDYRATFVAGS